MDMKAIDSIAWILVVVGAINWGLVGLFDFNLVAKLVGADTIVSQVVYALVGVSGLWMVFAKFKKK